MDRPASTPPLKCQGIKTKLVSEIRRISSSRKYERWIEPFCGSCVVALNVQPQKALLSDTNIHIIKLYRDIQAGLLTPDIARAHLEKEGDILRKKEGEHFYYIRERFNENPTSLDFLFLNRSCFNGIIRFNRRGKFNVPYNHKPERFAKAYITKISNQIKRISEVIAVSDWEFRVADFRETISNANQNDFIYADPPYAGRHVDYFNSWSDDDELTLSQLLKSGASKFALSTWHSNKFRVNKLINQVWSDADFHIHTREHFYHVGSSESLRHPMLEAVITNFPVSENENYPPQNNAEQLSFCEQPFPYRPAATS